MTIVVGVIAAWLATGALVGWLAARGGHWAELWPLTQLGPQIGRLARATVVSRHPRVAVVVAEVRSGIRAAATGDTTDVAFVADAM